MFAGWAKDDPPTMKKLPIEVDIPNYVAHTNYLPGTSYGDQAVGDLVLIAFYYLLRVGEYTMKATRNNTKQTVQFKVEDITFFGHDDSGRLRQLSFTVTDTERLHAHSATMKLDNQKNGWKGVCIHQESNGNKFTCPVKALARRINHIKSHTSDQKVAISAFYQKGNRYDIMDKDIQCSLKSATTLLNHPTYRGIPLDRIDTHSLRSGGANALALSGFSDREIQKMG